MPFRSVVCSPPEVLFRGIHILRPYARRNLAWIRRGCHFVARRPSPRTVPSRRRSVACFDDGVSPEIATEMDSPTILWRWLERSGIECMNKSFASCIFSHELYSMILGSSSSNWQDREPQVDENRCMKCKHSYQSLGFCYSLHTKTCA